MNRKYETLWNSLKGLLEGQDGNGLLGTESAQAILGHMQMEEMEYDVEPAEPTMQDTVHDLLTTKYTRVLEEVKYNYNAPHRFWVVGKDSGEMLADIHFQEGPIRECGVNGCANEDLIVMCIRRLQGFQDSEFSCRENAMAITKLEEALMWLRKRTMGRENRGVEGTHTV